MHKQILSSELVKSILHLLLSAENHCSYIEGPVPHVCLLDDALPFKNNKVTKTEHPKVGERDPLDLPLLPRISFHS